MAKWIGLVSTETISTHEHHEPGLCCRLSTPLEFKKPLMKTKEHKYILRTSAHALPSPIHIKMFP